VSATVAVIGAGPAGLMAAERLAVLGHAVTVYDRMPSPARKLLMAGRGGLNITHSEDQAAFCARYGTAREHLASALERFPPAALVAWANGLGIETFIGSSGRVFPKAMKASPLVRAWLQRLATLGVTLAVRHTWTGFDTDGALGFTTPEGAGSVHADATILALGGASWPRLGSNGAWVPVLAADGVAITPLAPANCGILIGWSPHLASCMSGEPLKRIALTLGGHRARGEAVITRTGLEGGAVYALACHVREAVARTGSATLTLDLRPDMTHADLERNLSRERGKQSMATFLRKTANLSPAAIAVLRDVGPLPAAPVELARLIKAVPLVARGLAGLDRAISSAGGVRFDAVDEHFMLAARPGVFVAGEMLDWEAPTGGYLLQATFATALAAANGADHWLAHRAQRPGA
jgi:uncharacterized flavoprotein (TIGR03862 family)